MGIAVIAALLAPGASADPAKPTNYRSEVVALSPATDAVKINVVGGDGFLQLEVKPGHTATVQGYQGEPWLRVLADNRVQENQQSPSTFLSVNRYGKAPIPPGVTAQSARNTPDWKTVDRNGRFVWHDHRIHYMTPQIAPRVVPGTNRVAIGERPDGKWVIPMTVDSVKTVVIGQLLIYPAPNPAIAWAVVLLVAAIVIGIAFAMRRIAALVGALVLVFAGGVAAWTGWHELAVVPAAAGGNPLAVVLPAVAALFGMVALALRGGAAKAIAVLAGAAALGAWVLLRITSFGKAVPLGDLSPTLTRLIYAGVLGGVIGAIVSAIASGGLALRLPDIDDDE